MRLLEQYRAEQTIFDGAQLNHFIARNATGRVFGLQLTHTSQKILISSGLVIVRGYRVSFDNEALMTFDAYPASTEINNLILRVTVTQDDSSISLVTGAVTHMDEIEKGVGVYDYLLGTYTITPDGVQELTSHIRDIKTGDGAGGSSIGTPIASVNMQDSDLIALLPTLSDGIYVINTLAYGDELLFVQKNGAYIARYNAQGDITTWNGTAWSTSSTLAKAQAYADSQDLATLNSAKDYTDTARAGVLDEAKAYADSAIADLDGQTTVVASRLGSSDSQAVSQKLLTDSLGEMYDVKGSPIALGQKQGTNFTNIYINTNAELLARAIEQVGSGANFIIKGYEDSYNPGHYYQIAAYPHIATDGKACSVLKLFEGISTSYNEIKTLFAERTCTVVVNAQTGETEAFTEGYSGVSADGKVTFNPEATNYKVDNVIANTQDMILGAAAFEAVTYTVKAYVDNAIQTAILDSWQGSY